jgi:hypothetical protein
MSTPLSNRDRTEVHYDKALASSGSHLWQMPSTFSSSSGNLVAWKKSPSIDFTELTSSSDLVFETESFIVDISSNDSKNALEGKKIVVFYTLLTTFVGSFSKGTEEDQVELPLPSSDWHRVIDPISLSSYYLNDVTGVTTSVHPYPKQQTCCNFYFLT